MLMKLGAGLAFCALLSAQDKPLTTFPYTPSLDMQAMDRSVAPCQDFCQYSCGTWIKQNPIPGDQARWDVYSKLDAENKHYLWGLLVAAASGGAARVQNRGHTRAIAFTLCAGGVAELYRRIK